MRSMFAALAATALMATPAFAEDPLMGSYGNTVTITNAKGEVTRLFVNEDKSYEAKLPGDVLHKGTWAIEGDQICFTLVDPAPPADAKPVCGLVEGGRKAGDTWETGEGDQKVTIAITAGR